MTGLILYHPPYVIASEMSREDSDVDAASTLSGRNARAQYSIVPVSSRPSPAPYLLWHPLVRFDAVRVHSSSVGRSRGGGGHRRVWRHVGPDETGAEDDWPM